MIANIYFVAAVVVVVVVCVCVRGWWVGKRDKSDILAYSRGLYLEVMRKSVKLVLQ